jgi:hypothetical protein
MPQMSPVIQRSRYSSIDDRPTGWNQIKICMTQEPCSQSQDHGCKLNSLLVMKFEARMSEIARHMWLTFASQASDPVTTSVPLPAFTLSCEYQQSLFEFLCSSQQLFSIRQRSPIAVAYTR